MSRDRSREDVRVTLNRLLALASRPGTPAEGKVAWAKAVQLAERYGFRIQRRRPAGAGWDMAAKRCRRCGAGFVTARTGRPRIYCSGACRVAAHRERSRSRKG